MNLEPIIQSEVSQKEKDKYHILIHIYGIQKDDTDEIIFRAAMEKQIQRTGIWSQGGGRKEKGGTNGDSDMETYTLPQVKQIANGNLLYDSGNSNQGSVTTYRGGMGWEVQEGGDICIPMADPC